MNMLFKKINVRKTKQNKKKKKKKNDLLFLLNKPNIVQ